MPTLLINVNRVEADIHIYIQLLSFLFFNRLCNIETNICVCVCVCVCECVSVCVCVRVSFFFLNQ